MAEIKEACVVKFQTTTDADIEEKSFNAGDSVVMVQEWANHYLVRDDDGHYYNLTKDKVSP